MSPTEGSTAIGTWLAADGALERLAARLLLAGLVALGCALPYL